jgi:nucleoid-associated protein YgaU
MKSTFTGACIEAGTHDVLVNITWEERDANHTPYARHTVYLPRNVAEAAFTALFAGVEVEARIERYYRVKKDDTLSQIAERFGLRATEIAGVNHLNDPNFLTVGQRLRLPETK